MTIDFNFNGNVTLSSDESNSDQPEILYQSLSRNDNTFTSEPSRRSWTDSRATYQNAAKKQYELLLSNHRRANFCVGINYFKEFFIKDILDKFKLIKEHLRKRKVIAFSVVEITKDKWKKPANRIHYHFLVHGDYSIRRLQAIFNGACQHAGLKPETDCRVSKPRIIPDEKTFKSCVKYILKYGDKYKDDVILFRPKTGINKIDRIGPWFIDSNDDTVRKDDLWKSLVDTWYPKEGNDEAKQDEQKPNRIKLRIRGTILIDGMDIKSIYDKGFTIGFSPRSSG